MRGLFLSGMIAGAMAVAGTAHALPVVRPGGPAAVLPLHLASVFCGQYGCQPITKVKHCNVNSTQNVKPGHTATQNNGIRRLSNCNF